MPPSDDSCCPVYYATVDALALVCGVTVESGVALLAVDDMEQARAALEYRDALDYDDTCRSGIESDHLSLIRSFHFYEGTGSRFRVRAAGVEPACPSLAGRISPRPGGSQVIGDEDADDD